MQREHHHDELSSTDAPAVQSVETGSPRVLLFVVNVAWFFCLHRLHLAHAARAAGFEVHVATAPDTPEHAALIRREGFHYHELALRRGRWSVGEELGLARALYRLYRKVRPTIVHHVTIKPVLLGTLAARFARLPRVVNAISGLGFVFIASDRWAGLRRLAVTWAYRLMLAHRSVRVIFENSDDLSLFTSRRMVKREQANLIRGAGVDLQRFKPEPRRDAGLLVLLPARMLWDKGVREYCEAAAIVRDSGVKARFVLAGGLDPGNPAAIAESWLNEQRESGVIEWWGHQSDMASVYHRACIVCLPSYREGLPTVLLEAAACGCALVTTDVPGCREVVRDGENGLLVPARDSTALANALKLLLLDATRRERLAVAAGVTVRAEFSTRRVQEDTLSLYERMMHMSQSR